MQLFHKAFLAGLGAMSLSKERIKAIVEELIKTGQVKEKEGEKLLTEVLNKASAAKKDVETKIRGQVKSAYSKMNVATVEQLKKMERRVRELERELAKSQGPRPAGKKKTPQAG